MKKHPHLEMLATVAKGLGELNKDVVFVGGATIGLHMTDPTAPQVRLSDDVDCVVEITTRSGYYELDEKLRKKGFKDPRGEDHPLCRWEYAGVIVDIMPTNEKILGFSNRWYKDGIKHAKKINLPGGPEIAFFSAPYLLASKIDAFKDRGHNDFLGSADMEDIVALIDGCEPLPDEIKQSDPQVRNYIKTEIESLLSNDRFVEAVRAHIESTGPTANRSGIALNVFKKIAQLS